MTGFLSDTSRPLIGGEHERDRAVVLDADTHDGSKAPCPGFYSALAEALDEELIELLRAGGIARLQEARPAAAAHVGEQRELGNNQRLALHVDQAQVHLPRLVGEHAEVDDLVRQPPHAGFIVITRRTDQQHKTAADGCTLSVAAVLPAHRAGGHALRDYSHLVNFWPEVGLSVDQGVDV